MCFLLGGADGAQWIRVWSFDKLRMTEFFTTPVFGTTATECGGTSGVFEWTCFLLSGADRAQWTRVWSFDRLRMTEFLSGGVFCLAGVVGPSGRASGPSTGSG
jgi:hypothetical protein